MLGAIAATTIEVVVPVVVAWRVLRRHCCWLRNLRVVGLGACYLVEQCPFSARCQAEEDHELCQVVDLPCLAVVLPCLEEDLPYPEEDQPYPEEDLPFEEGDLPYLEVDLSSCLEADLLHLEADLPYLGADRSQVAAVDLYPCLEAVPFQDVVPFLVVDPCAFLGLEAVPYLVSDLQPSFLVAALSSSQAAAPAS